MTSSVIPVPAQTFLNIDGSADQFPVRRIYCVGRNYADHAIEMGGDPTRESPFFFQKAADQAYNGSTFPYPPASKNVHFEVELVIALSGGGSHIPVADGFSKVFGYAVGIDFTRRDLQDMAKKTGRPWEAAKSFDHSAPMSPIIPAARIGHPEAGEIWLSVNGERKQTGDINQLIWKLPEIIAELSTLYTLAPGDLIMTGTPAGVGAVIKGDKVECGVDGVGALSLTVV